MNLAERALHFGIKYSFSDLIKRKRKLPIICERFSNKEEFDKIVCKNKSIFKIDEKLHSLLSAKNAIGFKRDFVFKGNCAICNKNVNFVVDNQWGITTEGIYCPECKCNMRLRNIYQVVRDNYKDGMSVYISEQVTNFYKLLKENLINDVVGSEYISDLQGVRFEDVTALSFENSAFDMYISNDVFEHVFNYKASFEEAYRVLKVGGKLIFHVPFNFYNENTILRATLDESGNINYLLPPIYHGNPIDNGASLFVNDFGFDLLRSLEDVGFDNVYGILFNDLNRGYLNCWSIVFVAEKNKLINGKVSCAKKRIDSNHARIVSNDSLSSFWCKGIMDNAPGSFKEFLLKNNMPEKIEKLKKGLDERSLLVVDNVLKKILHCPDYLYSDYMYYYDQKWRKRFETEFDRNYEKLFADDFYNFKKCYPLSKDDYDAEVFLYHHGLRFANERIKKYVAGKDFIDAGAYIGDSALVLFNYNPKKIYSFEISNLSINLYKKTMKLNNMEKSKYECVHSALSDGKYNFSINDNGGLAVNIFNSNNSENIVQSTDLDSFVNEKGLDVGFIKADIEGAMYKGLLGMRNTISAFRPVLSLAIYHSPEEFFETKPLLDEIVRDLNYKIEIDCHFSSPYHIYGTVIFAYPRELI